MDVDCFDVDVGVVEDVLCFAVVLLVLVTRGDLVIIALDDLDILDTDETGLDVDDEQLCDPFLNIIPKNNSCKSCHLVIDRK